MTLLDTSLVVPLLRSNDASFTQRISDEIGDLDIFFTSVTELELLQGARDEAEWRRIEMCLIAEIAISRNMPLLHDDRDFEVIATIRPLTQRRIDVRTA
jgi:predicted nucleic acid-binding protein